MKEMKEKLILLKRAEILELKYLLDSTDYNMIKEMECDDFKMSNELKVSRQEARDSINILENEINILEDEIEVYFDETTDVN